MGQTFRLIAILLCISGVLSFSCGESSSPSSSSKNKVNSAGQVLFEKHCALCHGTTGNKQLSGAKKLTESNMEIAAIEQLIAQGKKQMPSFSGRLTTEEIAQVAAYAYKFRSADE